LKKQGILPLTFKNEADYDLIEETAILSTNGLSKLASKSSVTLLVNQQSGNLELTLSHTMSSDQLEWFHAGSALNMIANNM
jgi:aconitase A